MCLIVVREPNVILNKDDFETAVLNNPDGWGLSVPDQDGKLYTIKDIDTNAEELYELLHDEFGKDRVMLHLRYTTAGETSLRNAHPFPILEQGPDGADVRMCHNGTLFTYKPKTTDPNKWESDTRVFTRTFVRPLMKRMAQGFTSKEILSDKFLYSLIDDKLTASSVCAFMDGHGNYNVVNPLGNGGKWDSDGTYFSNSYSFDPSHREPTVGKTMGQAGTRTHNSMTHMGGTNTTGNSNKEVFIEPCEKFSEKFNIEQEDFFCISDETIDAMTKESPEDAALLIKELLSSLYISSKKLDKATKKISTQVREIAELKSNKEEESKANDKAA